MWELIRITTSSMESTWLPVFILRESSAWFGTAEIRLSMLCLVLHIPVVQWPVLVLEH